MSCLGVLFAVGTDIIEKLRAMPRDDRPDYISSELEELYFEEFPECTCELDKSWDAMHRLLNDGTLSPGNGSPLSLAILGGEELYYDDEHDDYIISVKTPEQVRSVSKALMQLTDEELEQRYNAIPESDYCCPKSAEDMEYTVEYLHDSLAFWKYAADHGLWVLFTADQ